VGSSDIRMFPTNFLLDKMCVVLVLGLFMTLPTDFRDPTRYLLA
jgi:hypothetical protein